MSFRHKNWGGAVQIQNIISNIKTELTVTGNWSDIDTVEDVVRDINDTMDVRLEMSTSPNYSFLQITVGRYDDWNSTTHAWKGAAIKFQFGHVICDDAGGGNASDAGTLRMSYDDDHLILFTDYEALGANYRRGLVYCGLAYPYTSGDICLTGGSTIFTGINVTPTNDVSTIAQIPLMYDYTGSATKPTYGTMSLHPLGIADINAMPRSQIQALKQGLRYAIPIILNSTNVVAGGDNAGIRCRFNNMYIGMENDDISHGQTLRAYDTNEEYLYFYQSDILNKTHIANAILWRVA